MRCHKYISLKSKAVQQHNIYPQYNFIYFYFKGVFASAAVIVKTVLKLIPGLLFTIRSYRPSCKRTQFCTYCNDFYSTFGFLHSCFLTNKIGQNATCAQGFLFIPNVNDQLGHVWCLETSTGATKGNLPASRINPHVVLRRNIICTGYNRRTHL